MDRFFGQDHAHVVGLGFGCELKIFSKYEKHLGVHIPLRAEQRPYSSAVQKHPLCTFRKGEKYDSRIK